MYEDYWKLTERPFDNTVNPRFFFYSKSHEEALVRLLYSISENKGMMLLTGPAGAGKTLLCEIVQGQLSGKGFRVSSLVNPNLSPEDFLRGVLRGFGVKTTTQSKGELLWEVEDFARAAQRSNTDCVLIVDEAQTIEDKRTLEEIRLLANLQERNRYLITTFLVGGEGLGRRMDKVPEIRQRIGVGFRLVALTEEETGQYVLHRLATAGGRPDLFTKDALVEIHRHSEGVPRQINTLCDAALLLGSGMGVEQITAAMIKEAHEDATQLL